jgi:hypothetical protein
MTATPTESFKQALAGWPKRELQNGDVISAVVAEPDRVGELFECVLDDDEYVRMRAADALEKVCRAAPSIVVPLTARILTEMSAIDQPSVQWHVAQIVANLPLPGRNRQRAIGVVKGYLEHSHDWIVLNCSMETLAHFAEHDEPLRRYLVRRLDDLRHDQRPSVAKRAQRLHDQLATRAAPTRSRRSSSGALDRLRVDPVPALLASGHPALVAFARRELLGEPPDRVEEFCELPDARRILDRQHADGRWSYPNPKPDIRSVDDYDQLESYRQLGVLVHKFGLDRHHRAIERAREFLSSFQTAAGDYRGIYGRQYTPNYSAAITELLIQAGYGDSTQVTRTMRWLLSMRQHDGGWAIPSRTLGLPLGVMLSTPETLEADRTRPSAHLITGIVLRAFAAHPSYRHRHEAIEAGRWLKIRFFSRDSYPDRAGASYWLTFSYPFWWTDLLSALDTLAKLGIGGDDPDTARGIEWFVGHQQADGLWNQGRNRPKNPHSDQWVGLAICRMLSASIPCPSP